MYKPDNLEMLMNFEVKNLDLQVGGQVEKMIDLDLHTTKRSEPRPKKRATIRLRAEVAQALVETLTDALRRLHGTYVGPSDATKH